MSKSFYLSLVFISVLFLTDITFPKNKPNNKNRINKESKVLGSPSQTPFNINNISTWIFNNGDSDQKPTGNSGFIYPKGSNKGAVYESGFIWGATVNGEKRVGGSTYTSGLLPGRIIGSGNSAVREDETLEHVRIYRVRRDCKDESVDFLSEIADGEGTAEEIKAQYEKDWDEWPAKYGAPYEDIDGNGKYNPEVDIPGFVDADQTIWFVANDLDDSTSLSLYGSKPMGVELQTTIWGYRDAKAHGIVGASGNVMFRKYKLINKSNTTFDSMYVSMWSDPDLGDAGDDLIGCDTSLSLMYVYNGRPSDNVYGETPPAVGFDFLQGPIVKSIGDTAIVGEKRKPNYKNLPLSVNYLVYKSTADFGDPVLRSYNGTLQFHNLFRGTYSRIGTPFIDPNTGKATMFALAGDPVTKEGWIDGQLAFPGDRRLGMATGPFTMAVGDTQEVIIAELVGGGVEGVNYLDAIGVLKRNGELVQKIYNNFFDLKRELFPPSVATSVSEKENDVILSWDNYKKNEVFDKSGYQFQGYKVYQVSKDTTQLIGVFDKVDGVKEISQFVYDPFTGTETFQKVQFGTDSGLERKFKIEKDYINNTKLLKGRTYYFTVTAYTYTSDETKKIRSVETPVHAIEYIYKEKECGLNYGNTIIVNHTSGNEQYKDIVKVSVYDATEITGLKYTLNFFKDISTSKTLWRLTDENGKIVKDSVYTEEENSTEIIVDGFQITVSIPPVGIKNWGYDGIRWISGTNWGGCEFFGGMDVGYKFLGSTIKDGEKFVNVQLQWAGVTDRSDESANALATKSMVENPNMWSKGAVYNRNEGYAYKGIADIPFAAYDTEKTPPRRLNICMVEDADSGSANHLWDMGWNDSLFATKGGHEYLFIMSSDYDEGAEYNDVNRGTTSDVLYAIWPRNRGGREYLQGEFVFDIISSKGVTEADVFEFNSGVIKMEKEIPPAYSLSQNYPNPFNITTIIEYSIPCVGTTEPMDTKLVIYDILGREVVRLVDEPQTPGNYQVRFNASNLSSGVYIYRLQNGSFIKSAKMVLLK